MEGILCPVVSLRIVIAAAIIIIIIIIVTRIIIIIIILLIIIIIIIITVIIIMVVVAMQVVFSPSIQCSLVHSHFQGRVCLLLHLLSPYLRLTLLSPLLYFQSI